MALQTTYKETMDAGRPGQIVNTETKNLISRAAGAAVGLGKFVVFGGLDGSCRQLTSGDVADDVLGISARERSLDANNVDTFAAGDNVRVMTQGVIWVTVSDAVSYGDPVRIDPVTGNVFGAGATSGEQFVLDKNRAEFDSSAASGAVAKIRLK